MKIGILTLPFHTNYGGILQAFALKTVLEQLGHEATFITINQEIHPSKIQLLTRYVFRSIKKYLLRKKNVDIFWEKHYNERLKEQEICRKHTGRFVEQYLKCRLYQSFSDILPSDFEAIIVGSDQIWRKKYVPFVETSFLSFAQGWNIRRIAYAPSFGSDEWEFTAQETATCRKLIQDFNFVSVREQAGISMCQQHLACTPELVLDPTMLLDKQTYIDQIKLNNVKKSKGNLLCYIIDMNDEKKQFIEQIARQRNLTPFTVNSRAEDTSGHQYSLEDRIQPPVEEWLRGFYDAEYIVTDSFHACAFSIIFGKQFLVIGNKSRGLSRFDTLLKLFNLEDRIISETSIQILPEDYDTSATIHSVTSKRNHCLELLSSILK